MPNKPKLIERTAGRFYFYCPGCKSAHCFDVPRWSFNNDFDQPTFSSSLRVFYTNPETKADVTVCHLFLRTGKIEFCGDAPHELKGQTVDMVDWPEGYGI